MNLTVLDNLTMLLSSDFFFWHWGSLGIECDPQQRTTFQQLSREVVKYFMSFTDSNDYFGTSFTDERVAETLHLFNAAIEGAKAEPIKQSLIYKLSTEDTSHERRLLGQAWIIQRLTHEDEYRPLPAAIHSHIASVWKKVDLTDSEFLDTIELNATSWDHYLASLRTDDPESLLAGLNSFLELESYKRFCVLFAKDASPEEAETLTQLFVNENLLNSEEKFPDELLRAK
jgi:hypothetical protein